MKKSALLLIIFLLIGWQAGPKAAVPTLGLQAENESHNCFTIVAGKNATTDGSVLLAHNEDDRGRLLVNVYKVAAREHGKSDVLTLNGGATLPQVKNTLAMLWLEIPETSFADAYINESGVALASNACPSREDKPELTKGGIGFMLRRLIAERAQTARAGVRIAGELVAQFGYNASGRTYIIADDQEGWLMHIVHGKHWIARRVPDNEVAVIANCYTLASVDLNDHENYLGSPDIISYAVQRGWYNPEKDGAFNFARAYSDPNSLTDMRNVLRQWQGTNLLAAKTQKLQERLPFSFKPRRSIHMKDLFQVLRDHYEGSKYDLSDHYKKGSPNSGSNRTICTESTQYAFVAQLRDWLPAEIAHAVWICFRRPDSNGFSPWYASVKKMPDGYGLDGSGNALKNHFTTVPLLAFEDPKLAFNTFAKLSEMVDKQYKNRIEKTLKLWRNHEDFLFKGVKDHEKEFTYLLKTNKALAQKIIDNYISELEYRKWFLALELLREFRN
ncbi:MAG: C69 family dipeptidase [Candidatus Aminicenantes bacterium]|nr:C69 family dipeptidase [Candidatus Aminicenantes bacterium]